MGEFFYDGVIALLVGAIPVWLIAARKRMKRARSEKARTEGTGIIAAVLVLVWMVLIYGSFIEPRFLKVEHYAVEIGSGGKTLNVAVVSDLHLGGYRHREWTAKVVERVNRERPDLVLLAGDLVSEPEGIGGLEPLSGLRARFGAFAALGNWDYHAGAVEVRQAIESHGVEVLTNESVLIDADGVKVRIAGLDDLRYGRPDWDAALAGTAPDEKIILLVHNPDAAPAAEAKGVHLVVAGHTHGGQIRIPFLGPVPNLPTKLGRRFDKGTFAFGPTALFITPGAGESGPRARLFNPPEISMLRIGF